MKKITKSIRLFSFLNERTAIICRKVRKYKRSIVFTLMLLIISIILFFSFHDSKFFVVLVSLIIFSLWGYFQYSIYYIRFKPGTGELIREFPIEIKTSDIKDNDKIELQLRMSGPNVLFRADFIRIISKNVVSKKIIKEETEIVTMKITAEYWQLSIKESGSKVFSMQ